MNYRIVPLDYGWAIERKKIVKKDGKQRLAGDEYWSQEYFYGHLSVTAKSLLELALKDRARIGEITDIKKFIAALKLAEAEVVAAVGTPDDQ